MRTSLRTVWVLLVLGAVTLSPLVGSAEAADEGPLADVAKLKRLSADPDASWSDRWRAYKDVKAALDAAEGDLQKEAKAAYEEIKPLVAKGLRRTTLPVGGWIMGFLGASLLWRGFAVCITIAAPSRRKDGQGEEAGE